jgi:hypothetical protein
VTATAANGDTETVSGTMDIEEVCLASLVSFTTSYTYYVPEYTEVSETVIDSSSAYITAPPDTSDYTRYLIPDGVACSQTFSYNLIAGGSNPAELVIDESTGALTLTRKPTIKTTYVIEIDIRTTDGTNHKDHTTPQITIVVECGPESTTV